MLHASCNLHIKDNKGGEKSHQKGHYNDGKHKATTQTCKQQDQKGGGQVKLTSKGNGNGRHAPFYTPTICMKQCIRGRLHKG